MELASRGPVVVKQSSPTVLHSIFYPLRRRLKIFLQHCKWFLSFKHSKCPPVFTIFMNDTDILLPYDVG